MKPLDRLSEEQRRLARRLSLRDSLREIKTVAGADASYSRGKAFSVVVLCSYPSLEMLERATHTSKEDFPYIPGYLSYREAPGIARAFRKLRERPELLLVDGQGICHPRGFGLASHLGLLLDVPAIGVAKSRLCGEARGERLFLEGRQVGWLLETHPGKPIYVSPGHRVSLESAKGIVLSCTKGKRLPEPLQLAHLYSRIKKE